MSDRESSKAASYARTVAFTGLFLIFVVVAAGTLLSRAPSQPAYAQGIRTPTPPPPPTAPPPTAPPPTSPPPTPIPPKPTPIPPKPTPPPKEKDPTDTPSPTTTPTITLTPTDTGTPTATGTATSTDTPTDTPSPTPSPTNTPSPTPSPTNTPSATPSPTATSSPTPSPTSTPSPTPTAFAAGVRLNELMSNPQNVDWNTDGARNSADQWLELFNAGQAPADLSGWQLRVVLSDTAPVFTFPRGITLAAQGYLTLFRSQTALDLRAPGELRLLFPDGTPTDSVAYPALSADRAYGRTIDGAGSWTLDCEPSPSARNCLKPLPASAATGTAPGGGGLQFFRAHIQEPGSLLDRSGVLVTNLLLAIILALAMGFFGSLLNDTLESNEEAILARLAPLRVLVQRFRQLNTAIQAGKYGNRLSWLLFLGMLVVVLLLYGVIFAFLDPSFDFTKSDGWLVILALGLSAGLVSLADDLSQYFFLRSHGEQAVVRVHPANLVIAGLSTLISRGTGLVPGILAGSPAGLEEAHGDKFETRLHFLAVGSVGLSALVAWLAAPYAGADDWLRTVLLLVFAVGVQTLFFELMPLRYFHGRGIFEFNRGVWALLFILVSTIFIQTMLNPNGEFVKAFDSPNIVILSFVVLIFCLFSAAVWFYFNRPSTATAKD